MNIELVVFIHLICAGYQTCRLAVASEYFVAIANWVSTAHLDEVDDRSRTGP